MTLHAAATTSVVTSGREDAPQKTNSNSDGANNGSNSKEGKPRVPVLSAESSSTREKGAIRVTSTPSTGRPGTAGNVSLPAASSARVGHRLGNAPHLPTLLTNSKAHTLPLYGTPGNASTDTQLSTQSAPCPSLGAVLFPASNSPQEAVDILSPLACSTGFTGAQPSMLPRPSIMSPSTRSKTRRPTGNAFMRGTRDSGAATPPHESQESRLEPEGPFHTNDKTKKQITISPQVMEIDGRNTATYTMLPSSDDSDGEEDQQPARPRPRRRSGRRRSSRGIDEHRHFLRSPQKKHSHPFCEYNSGSLLDDHKKLTLSDHSLSGDSHQLFPHRASFFFKGNAEAVVDRSHEGSRSSSMLLSRPSVSFRTKTPERRKSHSRPRRKSMYTRRVSRHRSTSILDLPEGGYVRGSPFRKDRFADLGKCPRTGHTRIFCYNSFGNAEDPALILINGLGSSCTLWPDDLCEGFASRGLFVIRFDNRDAGLTSHWDGFKAFSMYKAAIFGFLFKQKPPYELKEMAQDTLDLMDYLGIGKAHVLGVSMGGMIAQRIALLAPQRIRSLTLMSTHCPGYRVESPSLKLLVSNFLDSPKSTTLEGIVDFYIRRRQVMIGDYPADTPAARQMFKKSVIRAPGDRKAVRRQFWAIQNEESREREVKELAKRRLFPVGVIHGKKDQLVPKTNGTCLHALWEGSELCLLDKMGHTFPEELHETIINFTMTIVEKGDKS